jgi:hypothetical protein
MPWKHVGSGCIDPRFIDLCTSWRRVVSFTPLPFYPRGKRPRYPFKWRLGGCQKKERSKNSWFYRDSNPDPSVVQPVASRYTNYATAAQTDHNKIWRNTWKCVSPVEAWLLTQRPPTPEFQPQKALCTWENLFSYQHTVYFLSAARHIQLWKLLSNITTAGFTELLLTL